MADEGVPELILASRSEARRAMLESAGLRFRVVPADVDEGAIRATLTGDDAEIEPQDVAEVLARAKAEKVSKIHPGAIVVGSDQVLSLGTDLIAKPESVAEARAQLLRLRARVHELHSSVAIAQDGETRWSHTSTASLTMRRFSLAFLDDYLAKVGPSVCETVGAYRLEGLGIQLFEEIDGDYFTILGLPLLALLEELRTREWLTT